MADPRIGLKHRLMMQAKEEAEKKIQQQKNEEMGLQGLLSVDEAVFSSPVSFRHVADQWAWVDELDPKLWALQEKILGTRQLERKLSSLAIEVGCLQSGVKIILLC